MVERATAVERRRLDRERGTTDGRLAGRAEIVDDLGLVAVTGPRDQAFVADVVRDRAPAEDRLELLTDEVDRGELVETGERDLEDPALVVVEVIDPAGLGDAGDEPAGL